MSIAALRWAWKLPVKGLAKLVLVRLADHANSQGQWNPSIAALAEDCGISERSVQYAIRELQDAGLVEIQPHYKAKSTYQLLGANRAPLLLTTGTTGANRAPQNYIEDVKRKAFEAGQRVGYKLGAEDAHRRHGTTEQGRD